jgi:hypothetical protein
MHHPDPGQLEPRYQRLGAIALANRVAIGFLEKLTLREICEYNSIRQEDCTHFEIQMHA